VTDEPQIAVLREEVRRAGRATRTVRLSVGAAVFIPLTGLVLLGAAWTLIAPVEYYQRHMWHDVAIALALSVFWAVLPLAALIALPLAIAFRQGRRRRLADRIASLDDPSRAAVLSPLSSDALGDTRKLANALLRDFGLPAELTPAAAPGARGDEANPAEPTRMSGGIER
jgi:hypothetical protein